MFPATIFASRVARTRAPWPRVCQITIVNRALEPIAPPPDCNSDMAGSGAVLGSRDDGRHSGLFDESVSTPHKHGHQGLQLRWAHERPVDCVGRLQPASPRLAQKNLLGDARASPGIIDDGHRRGVISRRVRLGVGCHGCRRRRGRGSCGARGCDCGRSAMWCHRVRRVRLRHRAVATAAADRLRLWWLLRSAPPRASHCPVCGAGRGARGFGAGGTWLTSEFGTQGDLTQLAALSLLEEGGQGTAVGGATSLTSKGADDEGAMTAWSVNVELYHYRGRPGSAPPTVAAGCFSENRTTTAEAARRVRLAAASCRSPRAANPGPTTTALAMRARRLARQPTAHRTACQAQALLLRMLRTAAAAGAARRTRCKHEVRPVRPPHGQHG